MNYLKTCYDESVVKIGKGFDVTMDKDCNLRVSGCLNFTKPITSAKVTLCMHCYYFKFQRLLPSSKSYAIYLFSTYNCYVLMYTKKTEINKNGIWWSLMAKYWRLMDFSFPHPQRTWSVHWLWGVRRMVLFSQFFDC